MTIRDLTIFVAVAEQMSMSKAADQLDLAQPTVSSVIASLEREYGVLLFDRLNRALHITDEGRFLLSRARSILGLVDGLEQDLGAFNRKQIIRMGATITVGSSVLAPIVSDFEQINPSISIQVVVDNTQTIETQLLDGAVDLALLEGVVTSKQLVVEPLYADELIAVCAPHFNAPAKMTLKQISEYPFILREVGSGTRERFLRCIIEEGLTVEQKWTCHSSDAILHAVLSAQGVTVISRRLVQDLLASGKLRQIILEQVNLNRNFSLVYHKDKTFTPAMDAFAKAIRNDSQIR